MTKNSDSTSKGHASFLIYNPEWSAGVRVDIPNNWTCEVSNSSLMVRDRQESAFAYINCRNSVMASLEEFGREQFAKIRRYTSVKSWKNANPSMEVREYQPASKVPAAYCVIACAVVGPIEVMVDVYSSMRRHSEVQEELKAMLMSLRVFDPEGCEGPVLEQGITYSESRATGEGILGAADAVIDAWETEFGGDGLLEKVVGYMGGN